MVPLSAGRKIGEQVVKFGGQQAGQGQVVHAQSINSPRGGMAKFTASALFIKQVERIKNQGCNSSL